MKTGGDVLSTNVDARSTSFGTPGINVGTQGFGVDARQTVGGVRGINADTPGRSGEAVSFTPESETGQNLPR